MTEVYCPRCSHIINTTGTACSNCGYVANNKAEKRPVDAINPSHYRQGKIEVIDAIDDWKLGFCLGNAIKYIARAGKKGKGLSKLIEDLEKAKWYINHQIEKLKEEN